MRKSWVIRKDIKADTDEKAELEEELAKVQAYAQLLTEVENEIFWFPNNLEHGLKDSIKNGIKGNSGVSLANGVNKPKDFIKAADDSLRAALDKCEEKENFLTKRIAVLDKDLVSLRYELKKALAVEAADD